MRPVDLSHNAIGTIDRYDRSAVPVLVKFPNARVRVFQSGTIERYGWQTVPLFVSVNNRSCVPWSRITVWSLGTIDAVVRKVICVLLFLRGSAIELVRSGGTVGRPYQRSSS